MINIYKNIYNILKNMMNKVYQLLIKHINKKNQQIELNFQIMHKNSLKKKVKIHFIVEYYKNKLKHYKI